MCISIFVPEWCIYIVWLILCALDGWWSTLLVHSALDTTSPPVTALRELPEATSLQRRTCLVEKNGSLFAHRAEGL